jgi:hypothetical protein
VTALDARGDLVVLSPGLCTTRHRGRHAEHALRDREGGGAVVIGERRELRASSV